MAQTDFFGPVVNALLARQRMLESNARQKQNQEELKLREKALEQQAKRDDAYIKQLESSDKIRRLQQGQDLFLLKELERSKLTGTSEASAQKNIPGAGTITEQPLLQSLLQQRGIVPQQTGVMVQGQESTPVNLDIPDLQGGTQLSLPIGTTRELLSQRLSNEATRRQEEERKLQLTGQAERIKASAKAAGEFPYEVELARQKNKEALDLEQFRQEGRKEVANIRGAFQLQAARERKAAGGAGAADLSNFAYEVGVGLQAPSGSVKDKAAVTNILHSQGWVTPPKDLPKAVDELGNASILLGKAESFVRMVGAQANPRANEVGRQIHQFFTGSNEIVNTAKTLEVDASSILRQMKDVGAFSNKDIERGMGLIPKSDIDITSNVRRIELLRAMMEIGINNKVRGLPDSQKKAIFEQYNIPFRVLTQDQISNRYKEIDSFLSGGKAESAPSKLIEFKGQKYPVGESVTLQTKDGPITGKFTSSGKFVSEE